VYLQLSSAIHNVRTGHAVVTRDPPNTGDDSYNSKEPGNVLPSNTACTNSVVSIPLKMDFSSVVIPLHLITWICFCMVKAHWFRLLNLNSPFHAGWSLPCSAHLCYPKLRIITSKICNPCSAQGPWVIQTKFMNQLKSEIFNANVPHKITQCGGGLEYLHNSPASHKRWQKGNSVPRGITGPPCSWGI
jgi:hypothetical protein